VGAGPGGMQAALSADRRGHRVTLYEQEKKVGGNMRRAAIPSFKQEVQRLFDYYKHKIMDSSVEVQLGTFANINLLEGGDYQVIVVAVGGHTAMPCIDGLETVDAMEAPKILERGTVSGENIAIIGGGLVGCEVGWYLRQQGKSVLVIDKVSKEQLMPKEHPTNKAVLLSRLQKAGVELLTETNVCQINGGQLKLGLANGSDETRSVDQVVIATGFAPRRHLWERLHNSHLDQTAEIFRVGDCRRPGRFFEAINEGALVGNN
ncbi:hypothetical protein C9439_02300, partial [archaeon SCG-AAA382B04]